MLSVSRPCSHRLVEIAPRIHRDTHVNALAWVFFLFDRSFLPCQNATYSKLGLVFLVILPFVPV